MAEIGKDIQKAKFYLEHSVQVAIPTETVYGLAANCFDEPAVAGIFEIKNRPSFDPLIVHVPDRKALEPFVREVPRMAEELASAFWPGPLTLILKKKSVLPDIVTSGLDTVGVRVPDHPLTLELLNVLDFPLAAPSANPFGYVSPTTARHVEEQLGDRIPYILDGGPCRVGVESTILGFEEDVPVLYRPGGIAVEDIEAITGPVRHREQVSSNPLSPGMLRSHYAPATRVLFGDIEKNLRDLKGKRVGVISFKKKIKGIAPDHQVVLSERGDLKEAATRLFSGLRSLDALNLQYILCEPVPDTGLGRAINDRLKRANAIH